jgi:plasmid stabilization system protein ParE
MVKGKPVIWPPTARRQLQEAFKYIRKDSLQNAEMVKRDILASTHQLAITPDMHRPDKYKNANDGNFRVYELHHYRIAYHIGATEITIVRVRHTSMEPLEY